MERTLRLSLNHFDPVPERLLEVPSSNTARENIPINLASLYHQYYLDSFGVAPPDPDPTNFEHLRFFVPGSELRLRSDGIGIHPEIRRHKSNELGQAFCRVFLHDYLDIIYFAHMAHVLDRLAQRPFIRVRVQRIQDGDAPDYLCASTSTGSVFLAEAKGRYASVSFNNREFDKWRKQFCRVVVKNTNGRPRKVKGFIVATRFGTEAQPRVSSRLFAEDPESPGEEPLDIELSANLREHVVALHYGTIASRLNQPILAAALQTGFTVPEEIFFPATVWQLLMGPLQGKRFVGGYISAHGTLPVRQHQGHVMFAPPDPFRLDVGYGTFVGLEESIFQQIAAMVRGRTIAAELNALEPPPFFYSAVSIMRDGTILAPVNFLSPVEERVF
jgi:hypothetical protein